MKQVRLACLALLLAVFLLAGKANAIAVERDGATLSQASEVREGTTYIPIRHLLASLEGWQLSWDGASRSATAQGPDFTLTFPIGDQAIYVDGAAYPVGGSYLKDGLTYVPLRAVAELLGHSVLWQGWELPILLGDGAVEHSQEDFYWLSRIISAESRGEPLVGQIAVGTVVLNRMASESFPDTIPEVIFDSAYAIQFEPVANGTVYDEPAASSVLAARLCLSGARAAGNSQYFYAPALSEGVWINANRPYYLTIGCHRFFL